MNQKITIPVAASLDTSSVEQAVNAMGQRIAQANRVQYQPVTTKSVDDVKRLNAALNEVLKTQTGLRKRVQDTGQSTTPFTEWDWARMYPHAASRGAAMQNIFERVVGHGAFTPLPTSPQQPNVPPGQNKPNGQGGMGGAAAGVAQAGLRAAGPAGGVAANAIGTGMSAGFGAGLMGLVGGMAALGISKAVGAVVESVGQAERNNVEYDKLKRILGDVGVSFGVLKGVVTASADNLKITYEEAGRLSTQFAKLANLSGDQYKSLNEELGTGVGLSRSLGLDPAAGVGLLGQMRGLGITTNSQDSRRFALLIGETIGKSNAFAKAEEVFEAIGGYASSQTRNSMGAANVAGYAGMYAGMVGSGIPGMDPTGAAGLLNKINATLAAGGAKGEASQFFSGIVGHRMGLSPFQTQVLREGGAFATNNEAFGRDSAYARFMGDVGPKGSTTFLQGSIDELRRQYGGDKEYLAMATANHLGVNGRQAMALLSIEPSQMGEMQDYAGDLTKISGSGITNLSKALYGSSDERRALANNYLSRRGAEAISEDDRKKLEAASGSDEALKQALASMAAKYDQERTTGSDIRDSKNALENIKTNMADKLVPYVNETRLGIAHIAGGGKKSPQEIMKTMLELESKDRTNTIKGQFGAKSDPLIERLEHLQNKERSLDPVALNHTYRDKPEVLDQKLKERADVQREIIEIEGKLKKLSEDKAKALEAETTELNKKLLAAKTGGMAEPKAEVSPPTHGDFARMDRRPGAAPGAAGGTGSGPSYDPLRSDRRGAAPAGAGGGTAPITESADFKQDAESEGLTEDEKRLALSIYAQESGGGRNTGTSHAGATGHMQMLPSTFAAFADKDWDINNPSHNRRAGMRYIKHLLKKSGGDMRSAAGGYYGGEGAIRPDGSLRTFVDRKNPHFPDTQQYADQVMARAARIKEGAPVVPAEPPKKADAPTPAKADLPPTAPAQPPRGKEGTPAASLGMQTESAYKPGAVTSAPLAPLSGEANVTVDLSPDARRLLATPAAPMSMRLGPATPLGLKAPASMRQ